MPFIAHAKPSLEGGYDVHEVGEHLRTVAELAERFAAKFGAADWARLAGLYHDLGKYHPDFVRYIANATGYDPDAHLEGTPGRVDHSTLGAVYAEEKLGKLGRVLAYIIAGHHAGLPDWNSEEEGNAALKPRLDKNKPRLPAVLAEPIPEWVLNAPVPTSTPPGGRDGVALWIRMIFSCLVDADFLDTEEFYKPEQAKMRSGYPPLAELRRRFDAAMEARAAARATQGQLSPVNQVRADVLRQCREKARLAPGLFSLTVPTGGGKTLSSLAFALDHAILHGKDRVIYVIPYTSIIEQTADVFRDVLGNDAVVEHHSALDAERETREGRLAAENWDAPVIVTTSVQFFESLFAARTSRTRKLHNIVNCVVVLDEAQMLPPAFLQPIVEGIRQLAADYGVTLVLCTATQPALGEQSTDVYFRGLNDIREIMDEPGELHEALRRIRVVVPADLRAPRSWEDLAAEIATHSQALCIVNRRDDCRELFRLLPEGAIHLSAQMCGAHRSDTLREIKRRLRVKEPVLVASTQLVEAGVDVDFPVVFRALGGLDSIAQAAGRCNREGMLRDENGKPALGRVVVFVPPRPAPAGLLRMAEESGRGLLERTGGDPLAPERFHEYFTDLYWKHGDRLDAKRILQHLRPDDQLGIRFRTAAKEFQMIDEASLPVIVSYNGGGQTRGADIESLVKQLRFGPPTVEIKRRLQRYVVNVPRHHHQRLVSEGHVEELHPGLFVQSSSWLYHPQLGLMAGEDAAPGIEDLVI